MASVLIHPDVLDWLDSRSPDLQERIRSKLHDAGEHPDHYLDKLTGRPEYKLRIGDYRALILWDKTAGKLLVQEIDHRKNIYG